MRTSVMSYFEETVKIYGKEIAIYEKDETITFSQLLEKSKLIAMKILEKSNTERNKPVPILMNSRILQVASFFGTLYSGNFYIPIDNRLPVERINKILGTLKAEFVLTDDEASYSKMGIEIPTWINIDEKLVDEKIDEDLIKGIRDKCISIDPMYVLFTSGSTGIPKGVVVTHQSVRDYMEWLDETFEFNRNTIIGNQAPFYFDNSVLDIYMMVKKGCKLVLIDEESFIFPNRMVETLQKYKVNCLFWVPSAFNIFLRLKKEDFKGVQNLNQIMFCGEVMPIKTLNKLMQLFEKAKFVNMYGPTEITDVCTYYVVERRFEEKEVLPIGKACNNIEILLLDQNEKLIKDIEQVGEICVRGECLAKGYYSDQEKTKNVFLQNPTNQKYEDLIYRTGDLGKYNIEGELIYIGRKDSQIKHMGNRIELGEIESVALNVEKIEESCCVYDQIKKKIILICSSKAKITEEEIYSGLKKCLPRYMLPSEIIILEKLLKTSNGKIDRNKTYESIQKKRGENHRKFD